MSNYLAIATVTAALKNLLDEGLQAISSEFGADIKVTTLSPETARDGNTEKDQVNIFLYHATPSAAWRNQDMPRQVKPGESAQPPAALDLFYLMTAYAPDDDTVESHRLLGRSVNIIHDHSVLSRDELESALDVRNFSDLHEQIERVRITPQPLSLEEMSKIWTIFQKPYRLSVAYQVSVVLIESRRGVRAPLPVLMIGSGNQGIVSQPSLLSTYPTLESLTPPNKQFSFRLGETLTLAGTNLTATGARVRFENVRREVVNLLTPVAGGLATQIQAQLADNGVTRDEWPAGFYLVSILSDEGTVATTRLSNALPLTIAPKFLTVEPPAPTRDLEGDITLTITTSPLVQLEQQVTLLVGELEVAAQDRAAATDPLVFEIPNPPAGTFYLRLRVDGADSILVNRTTTPPSYAGPTVTIP